MDFLRAGAAEQIDQVTRRRTPHDAVVHNHEALALDDLAERGQLETNTLVAEALIGLNEGAANIAVLDQSLIEGDAGAVRIADAGGVGRVRNGTDDVSLNGVHAGQFLAHCLAAQINAPTFQDGVGAGEVDVLKDAE